ncbi:Cloroperoxidase [Aureobasidium pullulans]|nr:Cloroperoxidase [Aureobasidium pullulans]
MYLGLWDCLKGFLTFDVSRRDVNGLINSKGGDYYYTRGNIANRGPCPGLNALANQGYLPRDGKNITLPQVEEALRISLHMEKALASSITRPLRPLLRKDGTFDLVLMRQHNVIEHDASFTRLDFREGDNYNFQPRLFRAMLDDAGNGPITISSLAKTYIRRNKESRAAGAPALPWNLWFVNLLQSVSLMNTAKMGGKLDREVLRAFYEEERFSEVILENGEERTLVGLVGYAVALLFCVVFRV